MTWKLTITVSWFYDVTLLFTNVPVDEAIQIPAEKAFKDDWFNKQHNLNITKSAWVELLNIATKNQLFQFEGSTLLQMKLKTRRNKEPSC